MRPSARENTLLKAKRADPTSSACPASPVALFNSDKKRLETRFDDAVPAPSPEEIFNEYSPLASNVAVSMSSSPVIVPGISPLLKNSPEHWDKAMAPSRAKFAGQERTAANKDFKNLEDELNDMPDLFPPAKRAAQFEDISLVLQCTLGVKPAGQHGSKTVEPLGKNVLVIPTLKNHVYLYFTENPCDETFASDERDNDEFESFGLKGIGYRKSLTIELEVDSEDLFLVIASKDNRQFSGVVTAVVEVLAELRMLTECTFPSTQGENTMELYVEAEVLGKFVVGCASLEKLTFQNLHLDNEQLAELSKTPSNCKLYFKHCEFDSNGMFLVDNDMSSLRLHFVDKYFAIGTLAVGVEQGKVESIIFENSGVSPFSLMRDELKSLRRLCLAAQRRGLGIDWSGKDDTKPFQMKFVWNNKGTAFVRRYAMGELV